MLSGCVRMRCVYVTFDGLLEPLGYSQVVRLVTRLAARGLSYRVISLEKAADLEDARRRARLRAELEAAGVDWDPLRFDATGTKRAAAGNLGRMLRAVARRSRDADLIHARSYLPAIIAAGLTLGGRPKLLFDTRGLWFDERATQAGRVGRALFAGAKGLEPQLYGRADGVVTLTELSAEDVRGGRLGPHPPHRPVVAIPTAVDFSAFDLARREEARAELAGRFPGLGPGPVLGFVGSVNAWYRTDEALELFAQVHRLRPEARLVVLSAQHAEIERRLRRLGVPEAVTLCTRAHHQEMPGWVAALDWGFLLLEPSPAKRASMPTKLGEFLAAGVRPIHYGCNEEVGAWVRRTGSGVSLDGLEPHDLVGAARRVALEGAGPDALVAAREAARAHFSLASAVDRYEALLRSL